MIDFGCPSGIAIYWGVRPTYFFSLTMKSHHTQTPPNYIFTYCGGHITSVFPFSLNTDPISSTAFTTTKRSFFHPRKPHPRTNAFYSAYHPPKLLGITTKFGCSRAQPLPGFTCWRQRTCAVVLLLVPGTCSHQLILGLPQLGKHACSTICWRSSDLVWFGLNVCLSSMSPTDLLRFLSKPAK